MMKLGQTLGLPASFPAGISRISPEDAIYDFRTFEKDDKQYFSLAHHADHLTVKSILAIWRNHTIVEGGGENPLLTKDDDGATEGDLIIVTAIQSVTFGTTVLGYNIQGNPTIGLSGDWEANRRLDYDINEWNHAVINADDAGTNEVFENNVKTMDKASGFNDISDNTHDWRIGSTRVSLDKYLDGDIACIGFWNRVLTEAEVEALYNSGNGKIYSELTAGEKSGLISWYDFDGESGNESDKHGSHDLTFNSL